LERRALRAPADGRPLGAAPAHVGRGDGARRLLVPGSAGGRAWHRFTQAPLYLGFSSPASMRVGSRFAGGDSGHAHASSQAHDGLKAKLKSRTSVAPVPPRSAPFTVSSR